MANLTKTEKNYVKCWVNTVRNQDDDWMITIINKMEELLPDNDEIVFEMFQNKEVKLKILDFCLYTFEREPPPKLLKFIKENQSFLQR